MTCPPTDTTPASSGDEPDPFVRACLVKLLHEVAADKANLPAFTGALWLTYRAGKRLRATAISGVVTPGMVPGATFPEMLGNMAVILSSRHGQVLCQSLLPPGFTGAVAIGYAMNFETASRHVAKPRPVLIGVIVQLDGMELTLTLDTVLGVVAAPVTDTGLSTLVNSTWAVAETIYNMSQAPPAADAAALAKQILDVEPSLKLAGDVRIKMSGSDIEGSATNLAARQFLEAAAAASAEEGGGKPAPAVPESRPRKRYQVAATGDLGEAVNAFKHPSGPPPMRMVARTYRSID